jgi:hypothetical protein
MQTLRQWLQGVKCVLSQLSIAEAVLPCVILTGLTDEARRLLERIGVPLPEPAESAWVAVRLEAAEGVEAAIALA